MRGRGLNSTAAFSSAGCSCTSQPRKSKTPFNKTYQSFGTTPMTVTSNFYESSRPLNFQSVKHNMPI